MALTVGPDHLGTPEALWRCSGWIEGLLEWDVPSVASAVVVAPHPDDETLGLGGLLQMLSARGAAVEVVAVTDGEASHAGSTRVTRAELAAWRADERDLALSRLGLAGGAVVRLRLADGQVAGSVDRLAELIASRLQPGTLCLAPWCHDGHPDHDASGLAAATAAAASGALLVEYPVWAWHWATPDGGELPAGRARRIPLTAGQVAQKSWAIEAFQSQLTAIGTAPEDGPILPAPILQRFQRDHEVVWV
jgi:LmbE family N-acetylglucosaminyl deacetylase